MYSPSPQGGSPLVGMPLPMLVLPPGAATTMTGGWRPPPAPSPGSRHRRSPSLSPAGGAQQPHPAAGLVHSLAVYLDRVFPHLHPVLRASGVAVLLLAPADEAPVGGWFRNVPPPPQAGKPPAEGALWEAALEASMHAAFLHLEQDEGLVTARVEAGLRCARPASRRHPAQQALGSPQASGGDLRDWCDWRMKACVWDRAAG